MQQTALTVPEARRVPAIPRVIMQTWKTREVPAHWAASPTSIARLMPGWRHVLLSDADNEALVRAHFPHLLDWYLKLRFPIQRADVIRYMWLYLYGGLYMDLDIELVAPLDELFDARGMETWLLKAPRNWAGHYTNFLMASTAGNPFWLHLLRTCQEPLPAWCLLPHHIISHQTGLGALTRAVNAWPRPIAVLPFSVLVPCDYCTPDSCSKPFHYVRFLKGQSWCGRDTALMNLLMCRHDLLVLGLLAILALLWVWRRHRRRLRA